MFLLFVLSCEKDRKNCNCNDPIEDLPWLKELKASFTNCSCQISIIQATYNKQTVFYQIMNDPLCNGYQQINLYDCAGAILKTYNVTDLTSGGEVTDQKVIYTCKTEN